MNANDILTIILLLPIIAVPVGLIIDLFAWDRQNRADDNR